MQKIIFLSLIYLLFAGCLSLPENNMYLTAASDNVYIFDKSKGISVSTEGKDSIYANNLADEVKRALEVNDYIVANEVDYRYILSVAMIAKTGEITKYKPVSTTNHAAAQIGANVISIRGSTYGHIPVREDVNFQGLVLTLYDKSGGSSPVVVWKGAIIGVSSEFKILKREALNKLVSYLGESKEEYLVLQKAQSNNVIADNSAAVSNSKYFSVPEIQINEMAGEYQGNIYTGYIKTKHVHTKQFNGYVHTFGLKEFDSFANKEVSELSSWALGLGAYTVLEDGVYTTHYLSGDIRALDSRNLQKVFSLPLAVGGISLVRVYDGVFLEFFIESKESVATAVGVFDDCFVIKNTLIRYKERGGSDINWVCPDVGIVKQHISTGRVDTVTNIRRYPSK